MKLKKLFGMLWVLIGLSLGGALAALILNALVRIYVIQEAACRQACWLPASLSALPWAARWDILRLTGPMNGWKVPCDGSKAGRWWI